MRVSTLDFFQKVISNFTSQRNIINDTQAQISSGKRILTPADDPIGAMNSLNYHFENSKIDQFLKNVDVAQSTLEYEDSILDSVTKVYQRLKELAIEAGNASLSPSDRKAIAAEMNERLLELKALANTRSAGGDYLFSGFNVYQEPVAVNAQGKYYYRGDDGQRSVMIGESNLVNISDPGKDLFFNLQTNKVAAKSLNGAVQINTLQGGQVASGTLSSLAATDLILNGFAIPASVSDGVSTTDSAASAIAIANAINKQFSLHGIEVSVNPNVVNLGVFTANPLSAGQLTLNGIAIIDPVGTESSLMASINAQTNLTGISATQPGGTGTAIVLTANDGRNIQLQTSGGATASFTNFNLTAGALNNVVKSSITLRDHHAIAVAGSNPAHAGLATGTYAVTNNSGTGVISNPQLIDNVANPNAKYSIIFNNPASTFSIYDDANPSQPLAGFSNITYVAGDNIDFMGLRVQITGTPNPGDVFGIECQPQVHQDIFASISDLINSVSTATISSTQLSYEIGLGLDNLDSAELTLLQTRAKIGARLNIVESQKNFNGALQLIAMQNLSKTEDLDYSEAITRLTQYTFTLEAAQQSFVKIQSLSLFYFIR
ncbi:MAG: flagellar hook-associated protein FlgL [Proteobacteria bacterium]|nr:flagellar hook-associated protein FlgL [Pseudomonadota bacterium]